jgi:lipid-A-disaccharide synthase
MAAADAILLASGTATLEAMLLKRPMVVAYRMGALSWALVSRLVKTRFAALPNILAGEALVPELIQDAATPEAMASSLWPLLTEEAGGQQLQAFDTLHGQLRQGCAEQAAAALLALAANDHGGRCGATVPG